MYESLQSGNHVPITYKRPRVLQKELLLIFQTNHHILENYRCKLPAQHQHEGQDCAVNNPENSLFWQDVVVTFWTR